MQYTDYKDKNLYVSKNAVIRFLGLNNSDVMYEVIYDKNFHDTVGKTLHCHIDFFNLVFEKVADVHRKVDTLEQASKVA